jgi:hypothetical protein
MLRPNHPAISAVGSETVPWSKAPFRPRPSHSPRAFAHEGRDCGPLCVPLRRAYGLSIGNYLQSCVLFLAGPSPERSSSKRSDPEKNETSSLRRGSSDKLSAMKDGSQQSKVYEQGIVMMRPKKTASQTKAQSRKAKASAATRTPKSERANSRTIHTNLMGAKVPKTLRNALDTLINSPRGREILASALVAAASAAAAALTKGSDAKEVREARREAADAGKQLTQDLSDAAASVVAGIVSDAARSLLPSSLIGKNKNHES